MRRTIVVTLLSAITVFCLQDRPAQTADDTTPQVATFRSDVTIPLGHILYGKPLATIETPLLAKGIVLDDGRRRYVLCAVDWCGLCNSSHALFRRKIADAAGTDVARVAVHCVHQHTAPYVNGDAQQLLNKQKNGPQITDLKFLDEVTDRLSAAVKKSLDNLQPFDSIGTGEAKVDRVASSRRIITEDGKFHRRMSNTKGRPELRELPEGYIDPMLKTITLARGDKPLVRLHYYATHPQSFYRDGRACYDVPGFARERLEKKENVFQIYFTGCAGDIAMGKYNDRSRQARSELTDRLFAGMEASVASTRLAPVRRIEWRTVPLSLPVRTGGEFAVDYNRARMKDIKLKPAMRGYAAGRVVMAKKGTCQLDLGLLEINNVRILHLPGEAMIEFQLFAQKVKPKDFVAVAAYGDLGPGYICTERAFDEGGYEPTASRVVPQSEELLKAAIRKVLGAN